MARTQRRNKRHLINDYCGTLTEALEDPDFKHHLRPVDAYVRHVARFTRDHPSGRFGVPRWYRRQHGSKLIRQREATKLHRRLRTDSWDNHMPDHRARDAKGYWW